MVKSVQFRSFQLLDKFNNQIVVNHQVDRKELKGWKIKWIVVVILRMWLRLLTSSMELNKNRDSWMDNLKSYCRNKRKLIFHRDRITIKYKIVLTNKSSLIVKESNMTRMRRCSIKLWKEMQSLLILLDQQKNNIGQLIKCKNNLEKFSILLSNYQLNLQEVH